MIILNGGRWLGVGLVGWHEYNNFKIVNFDQLLKYFKVLNNHQKSLKERGLD
jgi:hypothetical protein